MYCGLKPTTLTAWTGTVLWFSSGKRNCTLEETNDSSWTLSPKISLK